MKTKKKSIFTRIKESWKELDQDSRDTVKLFALFAADGALWGTLITAIHKDRQMKRVALLAAHDGYKQGQLDAYRDIASGNPYQQMEKGMKRLEQQGKATRF